MGIDMCGHAHASAQGRAIPDGWLEEKLAAEAHNYVGHNNIGHNDIGHTYIGVTMYAITIGYA